jgi:pimeloyl-ACP methyl ester carboxylesterase
VTSLHLASLSLAATLAVLLVQGCSGAGLNARQTLAANLAAEQGWQRDTIRTADFQLATWLGPETPGDKLTIYIEGDGFAWANRGRPSFNPTPKQPVGLALALRHADGSAAYLARPCQYIDLATEPDCSARTWTSDRFAEAAIAASNAAISTLKGRYEAQELILIGYSGGGAIAALVAARRGDVVRLVTIAAPLDHAFWTSELKLSPLVNSLNPAAAWADLTRLQQIHFVGADDKVIPLSVAESYRAHFADPQRIRIEAINDFDHRCCWVGVWPELLTESVTPEP